MILEKLASFSKKPTAEKISTARFFMRHGLARVHYLPLTLYFKVSAEESVKFRWSYFSPSFEPERSIFDRECLGVDNGELRFLWKVLRPHMTFLDIGAFHGIYSIIAGKRIGPSGRVIAFEPSRRERRLLRYHALLNPELSILVEPLAVSSVSGEVEFYLASDGLEMMNSLRPPATGKHSHPVRVTSIRLDDYCQCRSIDRIDCMKIDVEGGEVDLLRGGAETLARFRPLIICEVLDWVAQPWGRSARETVVHLQELQYRWFEFEEKGSIRPHNVMDHYPNHVRNFLAVPSEKIDAVSHLMSRVSRASHN
jgi:FkbM family methyltransferase